MRIYNWGIHPTLEAVREGFLEEASGGTKDWRMNVDSRGQRRSGVPGRRDARCHKYNRLGVASAESH